MYISYFSTKNSVLPNSFSTFSGLPVYGNFKPAFVFQPYDSKSITDSDSWWYSPQYTLG